VTTVSMKQRVGPQGQVLMGGVMVGIAGAWMCHLVAGLILFPWPFNDPLHLSLGGLMLWILGCYTVIIVGVTGLALLWPEWRILAITGLLFGVKWFFEFVDLSFGDVAWPGKS
jgi:hypothetical protein